MIRAPRTIAIVKRIFIFSITDEIRDRTTSLQSNSTLIVSRNFFSKNGGYALSHHQLKDLSSMKLSLIHI